MLLLPDAIPMSPDYQLSSLLETFDETQRDVIGVVECDGTQPSDNNGACALNAPRPTPSQGWALTTWIADA